jgi:DNA polymerase-3 subunit delta
MRLKPDALISSFKHGLKPIYLITGDEPLQQLELSDCIRQQARILGFNQREIFSTETGFQWSDFEMLLNTVSMFGDKKIFDLRVPNGEFGAEGAKTLIKYCNRPSEETVLLITAGKLSKASLKTRWFEAIEKIGIVIEVSTLGLHELIQWLQNRINRHGMTVDEHALKLLANRVEGNLLAAHQEIEKLYALYGSTHISHAHVDEVVADSSRHDVFKLVDALLSADINRIFQIIARLRAENVAVPIVLWALMDTVRLLCVNEGKNNDFMSYHNDASKRYRIWDKNRINLMSKALRRLSRHKQLEILNNCAKADRQAKGQEVGEAWETVLITCLLFSESR